MPSSAPLKENLPTVRVNLCSHILDSRRLRLLLATFVRSEIISTDRCTESALRNLCMCWRVRHLLLPLSDTDDCVLAFTHAWPQGTAQSQCVVIDQCPTARAQRLFSQASLSPPASCAG
jgi:hypothetical protein